MNTYQKYLNRIGLILICLAVLNMVLLVVFFSFSKPDPGERGYVVVRMATHLLPLAVGIVALRQSRHDHWHGTAVGFTAVAVALEILLILIATEFAVDSLVDLPLFLMGLGLYLMATAGSRTGKWKKLLQRTPLSMDLRISGKEELFDSLVMVPHLEVNPRIMDAVDRFLQTEDNTRPLHLHIHSAGAISESLQQLMIEDFRAHFTDEEKRINRFLEERFKRAVILIGIGVAALWLLNVLGLGEGEGEGIMRTIVGNYAAFSLWQVGSTHFERSAALPDLQRAYIAKHAQISFH